MEKLNEFIDVKYGTKITRAEFDLLLKNNGSDDSKYDYALSYHMKEGWCHWVTAHKNMGKSTTHQWIPVPKAEEKRGSLKFE